MIRRGKYKANFTVVPNTIFEDESLSAAARGTLGYLISRPAEWEVRHRQLMHKMGLGRDAFSRVMRELIAAGYIIRSDEQGRAANNAFLGYDYEVFDAPQVESCPQAAVGFPSAESRQRKTDSGSKKDEIKKTDINLTERPARAEKLQAGKTDYSDMGLSALAAGLYPVWEGSKGHKLWLSFRGFDGMPPFDAVTVNGQLKRVVWMSSLYPPRGRERSAA